MPDNISVPDIPVGGATVCVAPVLLPPTDTSEPTRTLRYCFFPDGNVVTFQLAESGEMNVVKSSLPAVTALFAIAAVVTELFGNGAFNKSPLVICFVVDADVSTIAISSVLSAVVRLGSWLTLGMALSSLSCYRCV